MWMTALSPRNVHKRNFNNIAIGVFTHSPSLLPATSCDQSEIVSYLLTLPALNRTLKDCDGCLAVEVTSDPNIRKMFEDVKVEN